MAPTSRKRARDDLGADETPKPRKRRRARRGEGGKKSPQSLAHPRSAETPPSPDSLVTNNTDNSAQPRKRVCLELENSRDVSTNIHDPHIFRLPPEIIGEILVLTGSPRHILAFARTCKHFCYTLIGEGAQYIWRRARRGPQCSFPKLGYGPDISLPDPPKSFFSESAFAAFLFDPGPCSNCGQKTFAPYASFALRIRFCNDSSCKRLPDNLSNPEQFQLIVPTNERSHITTSYGAHWPFPSTPTHDIFSHDSEIAKAREEFLSETEGGNEKRLEALRTRNKEWMVFCTALAKWRFSFDEKYRKVKKSNEIFAREAATMFGWEHSDMVGYTIFGKFCHQKTKLLEVIHDVHPLRDQIESELLALEEKRQRRKREIALTKNRENVEALYNRLRSTKAYGYLPSLPTFRQLPVVQLLQSGIYDENRNIADTLQNNPLMRQQLDQEVERWIETAKQDLAVVLGFPRNWKSANKNILHPVERCTAWFHCTKCTAGINYQADGSLDFSSACRHVCPGKHGKNDRYRRSKHAAWNPENFIKDEKAINVMKSALSKLKLSEETMTAFPLRHQVSPVICTSCEPSMVLDSKNMIGHSHRHDNMEISFVFSVKFASQLNGFAYPYGIAAKFLRNGGNDIKKEIDKKNFGCRICLRRKATEAVADVSEGLANPTGGEDDADMNPFPSLLNCTLSERPEEMPPLFTFNGLRSHLKAKHGIERIRDEDFFCSEPVGKL